MPKAAFTDLKAYDEQADRQRTVHDGRRRGSTTGRSSSRSSPATPGRASQVRGRDLQDLLPAATPPTPTCGPGKVDLLQTIPPAKVPEAKRLLGDRFLRRAERARWTTWASRSSTSGSPTPTCARPSRWPSTGRRIVNAVYNGDASSRPTRCSRRSCPGYRENACGEACTYDPAKAKAAVRQGRRVQRHDGPVLLQRPPHLRAVDDRRRQPAQAQPRHHRTSSSARSRRPTTSPCCATTRRRARTAELGDGLPEPAELPGDRCGVERQPHGLGEQGVRRPDRQGQRRGRRSGRPASRSTSRPRTSRCSEMPMIPLWNWRDQAGHSETGRQRAPSTPYVDQPARRPK